MNSIQDVLTIGSVFHEKEVFHEIVVSVHAHHDEVLLILARDDDGFCIVCRPIALIFKLAAQS